MHTLLFLLDIPKTIDRASKDVSNLIKRFSQDMTKKDFPSGNSSSSLPRINRKSSITRNQSIGGFDSPAHLKVVPDIRSSSLSREV